MSGPAVHTTHDLYFAKNIGQTECGVFGGRRGNFVNDSYHFALHVFNLPCFFVCLFIYYLFICLFVRFCQNVRESECGNFVLLCVREVI